MFPRTYPWFLFSPNSSGLYLFHICNSWPTWAGRSVAGILVRHSAPGSGILLRIPLHVVAFHMHLCKIYTICFLYLARDDLIELLCQLSESFLLVGDFNIRHPSWGDTIASPNAATQLSVILNLSLLFEVWSSYALSSFY